MDFKTIETDADWSAAIELRNRRNWSFPVEVDEEKSFCKSSRETRRDDRFLGIEDSRPVGYGVLTESINSAVKGSYWVDFSVDPKDPMATEHLEEMIEEGFRRLREFEGTLCRIESRGENEFESETLQRLGFNHEMRIPFTQLFTDDVDFTPQENMISVADFLAAHPENGLHDYWRLEMDVASDLPLPYPFVESPFETFCKVVLNPANDLRTKFVMFEDGVLKGLSQLWPSRVTRDFAATGLTGVRREFRRQKVATRMKQHAIAWAKEQGIKRIFTDNEENNPMYQLNLQLGFRHVFDFEVYSKPC